MPFLLIKGRFIPQAGIPDGDSVRFHADNGNLWAKLKGTPPELGKSAWIKDTVQLRFEGIDAIEKGAVEPLATQSLDNMLHLIGYNKSDNPEPVGYILTRMTDDSSGRPIAFVFAGKTSLQDGTEVFLDGTIARTSVNVKQAKAGFGYPLYYNTLFASLREEFNKAIAKAKKEGSGYWPFDQTNSGVTIDHYADLTTIPPIWPKLWRRLEEFLRQKDSLDGFLDFLENRNERVDIMSTMEECGLQDLVEVYENKVRLKEDPVNIRVVGKAGQKAR
jgi:endonuclease YncB( thermonuclease family)